VNAGETILPGARAAGGYGGFNPNFDVPRMIYRIFDPATLTWSAFDSTELYADNLVVAAGDSIVTASFGAPVFRTNWPPYDKAGQSLPNGFTINGVGAYDNLKFLPRGTRFQYYWKAVDIAGGTIHQFSSDNPAREVEDLPTLPGGLIKAPDIIEVDILPRKYPAGAAGTLLAGKTDTPILNLDAAYSLWSFQYDPMTQALRGLGVRADRWRFQAANGQANNIGGHELIGPPDNQRADRGSNYFPNMTEYPIRALMSGWYKILIQSSHGRTGQTDDEADARLIEEWWVTDTGTNGGDRCIFASGDDYFNSLLNIPAGEASARRRSYGQNVMGVNSAVGAWNGTTSVPYPTVEDRFANPAAGPGLLAGYTVPVDGGCPGPNRFDALTKSGSSEHQNSAFYPLFGGVNDVAAVATQAERDPGGSADNDRNKALGYGFSIQYVRKVGVPNTAANYVRSGVEERMRIMYKFLASCRGPRSGAPADTAKCWPCPTDANMTGNWNALAGFQTGIYGPLYPIQDNQAATGVADDASAEAPRVNKLEGNFPNPFNPQTTIKFSAAQAGKVTLRIFNVGGQLVRTITAKAEVGANEVRWNGKRDDGAAIASGIYFYKVKFADGSESGSRMALVK
jgi:flagellar hook capping protein FlgD